MRMVTLKTADGLSIHVEAAAAMASETIKAMLEDCCVGEDSPVIPLPNVHGRVLEKVVEYCKMHRYDVKAEGRERTEEEKEEMESWDLQYIDVDEALLYHLLMAANYLQVEGLLSLGCDQFVRMIRGKYPHEIREMFHIKDDIPAEDATRIRMKYPWAFEGEPGFPPHPSPSTSAASVSTKPTNKESGDSQTQPELGGGAGAGAGAECSSATASSSNEAAVS